MVSEFFTPIRKPRVPNFLLNHQLFQDKNWPFNETENRCYYYTQLLDYGKDNYQNRNKITNQIVNLATQIFLYTFFNCQALFAFDNNANHVYFAENVFLAKKMNLNIGRKQPWMRNRFNNII